MRLQLRLDAVGDDPPARGAAGDLSTENDLHVVRAPERELVFEHQLKPVAYLRRARGDTCVRHLQLADRQSVAVAAVAVGGRQRRGQPLCQYSQKRSMSRYQRLSQIPASAPGSATDRKPLSSGSKAILRLTAWRLAHSWPLR